jgi:hypothetical protein
MAKKASVASVVPILSPCNQQLKSGHHDSILAEVNTFSN